MRPSTQLKRQAALAAAERQFLATGYESVTMESIATESHVAKQSLYNYFGTKRSLFLELVTAKTQEASRSVLASPRRIDAVHTREGLRDLLIAQLSTVMTPSILALRRLVIGERSRSPELAEALYDHGPRHAILALAAVLADLTSTGIVHTPDPERAAAQLNWLVMGEAVNRAMLLGDGAIPSSDEIGDEVDAALEVFFAAYGAPREAVGSDSLG